MNEYHKIQTVFKRDPSTRYRTLLNGEFSMPEFEYLKDNMWVFTEKVDGTNIRVMFQDGKYRIGGKTNDSQIPAFLIDRLDSLFGDKTLGEVFTCDVCLYGEGFGKKIQKNGSSYIDDGVDFVLFDVKMGDHWLERFDVEIVAKDLNIQVVPIVGHGSLDDMVCKTRAGFKSYWGDFAAEGIVARPPIELQSFNGQRIITKLKTKDFNDK